MVWYLSAFFACLLIDRPGTSKNLKYFLIFFIAVITCFGYMVGSDWREYERMYYGELGVDKFTIREFGFVYFIKACSVLIKDFWVFSGIVKILFLCALLRLFSFFTSEKWTALGFSFCYFFLFMVVDCPLRFMLASTIVLYSFSFFLEKKWLMFSLCSLLAFTFQNTIIFPIVIILLSLLGCKIIKCPKWILLVIYAISLIISTIPDLYTSLYSRMTLYSFFDTYTDVDRYTEFATNGLFTLGGLKNCIFGLLVISFKDRIAELKKGDLIFYFSYVTIVLQAILFNLPTAFRIIILSGFFIPIAIAELCIQKDFIVGKYSMLKRAIIVIFAVVLLRNVSGWSYSPYSNSIYYILTEHLPYSYRYNHNFRNDTLYY